MLIAVSIPIPGTLFNKATLPREVSVCDNCLTCLVTFKIEARRFLHSEINTDSDSSPPSSFISRLSSHFVNLIDQWLLEFLKASSIHIPSKNKDDFIRFLYRVASFTNIALVRNRLLSLWFFNEGM